MSQAHPSQLLLVRVRGLQGLFFPIIQGARVQWSENVGLSMDSGAKGPNITRVQGGKGAKVQASTSKGSRYRLVRPYQLGNRSGKRSSVDERRAARMARPERGRARFPTSRLTPPNVD